MARKMLISNKLEAPTPWLHSVSDLSTQRGVTTPKGDGCLRDFLEVSMAISTYRITRREAGMYEVRLLVDGTPCPGRIGMLSGRPGHWEAEWVDGSRIGSFRTRLEGAKALENYRYFV